MIERIIKKFNTGIIHMLGANTLNKVITMLSNMIITRILSKSSYGVWTFALNIYSYLNIVNGLGLLSGAFQVGAEHKKEQEEYQTFKYCIRTGLIIDAIFFAVFLVGAPFVTFSVSEAKPFVIAYIPLIGFEFALHSLQYILYCENRIKEYAKSLNLNTVLFTIGTCVGSLFDVKGIIIGRFLAYTISITTLIIILKKELVVVLNSDKLTRIQKKSLWQYSLFTGATTALNSLLYLIDVSMIASLIKSAETIAVYKVGTLIPNAMSFVPASIVASFLPQIVAHNKDYNWLKDKTKRLYANLIILNVAICSTLFIFTPQIITIISGSQYLESVPVFRLLIVGYFFSGSFRTASANILASMRHIKSNLIISSTTCALDIIFNYMFIRNMGMIGASYATLVVEIITALLSFSFMYKAVFLYKGEDNEKKCTP